MAAKPDSPANLFSRNRILTKDEVDRIKSELVEAGIPPDIYRLDIDGETFVFRPLYRAEWTEIMAWVRSNQNTVTADDLDLKVCERGLVWPPGIVHAPEVWAVQRAGVQPTLSKMIQARSGFFDGDLDQSEYLRIEPLSVSEQGPRPGPDVITELKAKYKNYPLQLVQVGNEYFVIRPLNHLEWRKATGVEGSDSDLMVAERGTVWSKEYPSPPDFKEKLAGTVQTLSMAIIAFSGFNSNFTVDKL